MRRFPKLAHGGHFAVIQAAHVRVYKSNKTGGVNLFNALRKSPRKRTASHCQGTRGTI